MDAAHDNRRQLGQLMVDEGFITFEQLTRALAEQDSTGRPLGKVLVELGFASEGAVANALAEQHGGLLKTEFGISAGLHAVEGGATRQATAAATVAAAGPGGGRVDELEAQLEGVLRERNALTQTLNELKLRQAAPAPDPAAAARVAELESQLESVLAERNAFAESVSELQARPPELAPDPAAAARVAELEAQLEAVLAERNAFAESVSELQARPPEVASDPSAAAARVAELETHLHEVLAERNAFAENLNELHARLSDAAKGHEADIARATAAAGARIAALEAEVNAALTTRSELETAAHAGAIRISELEHELAELRQRAEQPTELETPAEELRGRAHLLFVPSASGYTLIDFEGPDPTSGAMLDVGGVSYLVNRVGASPFPGDRLRCVYLDLV